MSVFIPLISDELQFLCAAGLQTVIGVVIHEQHAVVLRMQVSAQAERHLQSARAAVAYILRLAVDGVTDLQIQIAVAYTD